MYEFRITYIYVWLGQDLFCILLSRQVRLRFSEFQRSFVKHIIFDELGGGPVTVQF